MQLGGEFLTPRLLLGRRILHRRNGSMRHRVVSAVIMSEDFLRLLVDGGGGGGSRRRTNAINYIVLTDSELH